MNRTDIYLDARQTILLDRLAAEEGLSRAEIIRRILDRALNVSDEALTTDVAAIERSLGVFADGDAPRRSPADREEHLQKMWRISA